MPVIALLTDFTTRDWFVGSMKGIILDICPMADIVDITHDIPQGDIRAAAFVLRASFKSFPPGTVFCVVVDPGVGSNRAALGVQADFYRFVGPDNGVLSFALQDYPPEYIYRLENQAFFREPVSATFHGRDIFAPIAAHLCRGDSLQSMGPRITEIERLEWPPVNSSGDKISGSIVYIDTFGNAFTNVTKNELAWLRHAPQMVKTARKTSVHFMDNYSEAPSGKPLALVNSSGHVEIAVNCGNAASLLKLTVGDPVEIW